MKKIILLFFIISFIACDSPGKKQKNVKDVYSAEISFNDSIYDFGDIAERTEPYHCTFYFKNIGEVPAVILHVKTSCNCTSGKGGLSPIPVGKEDSIEVYLDSGKAGYGFFDKAIKVVINSERIYTLKVKGNVIRPDDV